MAPTLPKLKLTYFYSRMPVCEACRPDWPSMLAMCPLKTNIAQFNGILSYAGTLGGLYPAADPLKAALVDQVVLHIDDMNMAIFPSIIERDNNKKTLLRKDIVEKKFPEMLSDLDKVLEKHSAGKWSVGNTLTVADLCVYVLIGLIKSDLWNGIPTNMADKYTCAHRVYEAVRTHPKVAEWELAHKK
ncbi:hypothetical protein BASA81_005041 [Batrachochytrium salamandrivorans]|nr:hypothetical protein BASA81_005041 [Batrachochytrium salamandrivorans]